MRTFSCLIFKKGPVDPTLSFVVATDESRARELARRMLKDTWQARSIEVFERGKLLWAEPA